MPWLPFWLARRSSALHECRPKAVTVTTGSCRSADRYDTFMPRTRGGASRWEVEEEDREEEEEED